MGSKMSQKLDVRGEICPYPMMRTVSMLKKLSAEERTLEVLTDHAPTLDTIPTQAARLGFETAVEEVGGSEWRLTLTRIGSGDGA
ncbi:MAG: sulfurtransferase TusA family protein [Gemmatimonadota bacterium]